jgi:hypothetical protein
MYEQIKVVCELSTNTKTQVLTCIFRISEIAISQKSMFQYWFTASYFQYEGTSSSRRKTGARVTCIYVQGTDWLWKYEVTLC